MTSSMQALAINGGEKAIPAPLPPRNHFGEAEKAACMRVIDEAISRGDAPGYGGPEEESFCREFAALLGGGYADAVNSGSTAVFTALRALELPAFSEVIVPPFTDAGGIMPVVMANHIPIVADTEPDSFNLSLEGIRRVASERTRAILVAHIAGEPADMEAICAFAKDRGIRVIEDCAQAHGALIHGRPVGSFGDIAAFSLMFGKHVCAGGQGGMVFTRDEELYWRMRRYSDRGKPFGLPDGATNSVASLNFNMDELHCAIGRVQITKVREIAERRRAVVGQLTAGLADCPALRPIPLRDGAAPSYWFWRVLLDTDAITCDKDTFCHALHAEGLPCDGGYALPFTYAWYTERNVFPGSGYPWSAPAYRGDRMKVYTMADVPQAAAAMQHTLILRPHENWTSEQIAGCLGALHKVCTAYAR